MTFNVKINPNPETKIVARVAPVNGILQPTSSLTIRNQLREYQINSIQDLPDVAEEAVVDGATLVYNANSSVYEVKQLDVTDLSGIIDGGEF